MQILFFVFLLASTWAGSSSAAIAELNRNVVSGNIHSLESFISQNKALYQSPAARKYRNKGLMAAVKMGRTDMVDLLLREGGVNTAWNINKATEIASTNGHADIVKKLLAQPNLRNPVETLHGLIFNAAKNGEAEVLRVLLADPRVNPTTGFDRALETAALKNQGEIVKLLILDGRTKFGHDLLELFASFGNVDLVQFLLSRPTIRARVYNIKNTIFDAAVDGNYVIVKTIVEAGFKMDQRTINSAMTISTLSSLSADDISISRRRLMYYLKSLKEKPNLSSKPLITMTEECAICLGADEKTKGFMTTCGHQFHVDCLQNWLTKHASCPVCRSIVLK